MLFQNALQAVDLALPRQKHQHMAVMRRERFSNHARLMLLRGLLTLRASIKSVDRPDATRTINHRCLLAQHAEHGLHVQRRGHDEKFQVIAQRLHVQSKCQPKIRLQAALVKFVENDARDPFEKRIVLHHPCEDTLGQYLDPCGASDPALATYPIADRIAHVLPQQLRHVASSKPGCDTARLEQQPATGGRCPRKIKQGQRRPGCFASTGLGDEQAAIARAQCVTQWLDEGCIDACTHASDLSSSVSRLSTCRTLRATSTVTLSCCSAAARALPSALAR